MYLCYTCSLCLPSHVRSFAYTCQCAWFYLFIYVCICMYAYIWIFFAVYFMIIWESVQIVYPWCVYCVYLCVFIYLCGFAMQKWDAWVSFLETRELAIVCLFLISLISWNSVGLSGRNGFCNLSLYLWFLPHWSKKLYWHSLHVHWWIIPLRKAVMWACLIEVTLEEVVFFF